MLMTPPAAFATVLEAMVAADNRDDGGSEVGALGDFKIVKATEF
jgi:hypothetical protein